MLIAPGNAETLAFEPTPVGQIVIHRPGETVITREWDHGDQHRCRLCPLGRCGATARGTCTVVAPGYVSDASASAYRVT